MSSAQAAKRPFPCFPEDATCPICETSEDKPCFLLPIDGTGDGKICEAQPTHVDCLTWLSEFSYNKAAGIIYLRV